MHHRSKTAQLETGKFPGESPRFLSCTPPDQGLYPQKNFREFCCNPPKSRFAPRSPRPEQAHYRACTAPPREPHPWPWQYRTTAPHHSNTRSLNPWCATVRSHAPRARANASTDRHTPAPTVTGAHSGTQCAACQCTRVGGACQCARVGALGRASRASVPVRPGAGRGPVRPRRGAARPRAGPGRAQGESSMHPARHAPAQGVRPARRHRAPTDHGA